MPSLKAVEDEIDRLSYVIKAAEDWVPQYGKDPKTHAKLIKIEVQLDRSMRGYFRDLSERVVKMINWSAYQGQVTADFDVRVLINDDDLDLEDDTIMQLMYDPIASGVYTGVSAGEEIYNRTVGLTPTSVAVQQAARERVAELVGKRLNKQGVAVPNPNADYHITETTRQQIRDSIATSLSLGEKYQDAIARLQTTIADYDRASMIAATESVNAYQKGLMTFGDQSGAVGKEWISSNPDDECGDNDQQGIIDINDDFQSGDSEPAAHPNCRCSLRLVYPEELNSN
jgi:hypothetical protein